jgi:uncharacterized membrane protein
LLGVCVTGLILSGYLTLVHYEESALVCTAGGGCETVQQSRYAELASVPVALLGLVYYATLVVLAVWDSPTARTACAALGIAGLVFAGYLLAVQLFVLDATCVWCVVNDLLIAPAAAALTVARVVERDLA